VKSVFPFLYALEGVNMNQRELEYMEFIFGPHKNIQNLIDNNELNSLKIIYRLGKNIPVRKYHLD